MSVPPAPPKTPSVSALRVVAVFLWPTVVPWFIWAFCARSLTISVVFTGLVLGVLVAVVFRGEPGPLRTFSDAFRRHPKSNVYFLLLVALPTGVGLWRSLNPGAVVATTPARFDDETAFIATLKAAKEGYDGNEIQMSAKFNETRVYDRQFFESHGNRIERWEGWIKDLSTDKGGGTLSLWLKIGERDFTGFDISFHQRSIASGSAIYAAAGSLHEGACAYLSGVVNPVENSATESGAMRNPEYEIYLTDLKPCW